jgi:large subunit ribosomal protein L10
MATQKKIDQVQELTDKVGKAKSIVIADYKGLKAKQLEELRKNLKKTDAELIVTKNTLMKRAMGDNAKELNEALTQETAAVFSYKDEVAGVKELFKFFKTANLGKAKGGFLAGKTLTAKEVETLSTLPSKEVLLSRLVGQLMAPVSGLHHALSWNINKLVWALNSVKEKKA